MHCVLQPVEDYEDQHAQGNVLVAEHSSSAQALRGQLQHSRQRIQPEQARKIAVKTENEIQMI